MERKVFDPNEWIYKKETIEQAPEVAPVSEHDHKIEIEGIIESIEEKKIDITSGYKDWRNTGFALAEGFGEAGREYFHRISCFYPGYVKEECDRQYDKCLKSKGHGITLKTFFHQAKAAGIHINIKKEEDAVELKQEVENLPAAIYEQLPEFLKKVVVHATSNEERDILLLGTLVVLSGCLPTFYGVYDGKKVFANLFLFITARASAGKGRLVHCKQLVLPIHRYLREQAKLLRKEYEVQLLEYNQMKGNDEKGEKPGKPPEKMLLIPANNSTTGVFQLLHDNEGRGMLFETEGDTLAQAFKSDYGNYSDGFRKAFHHETISYYRRTDREYVDIESPCVSTVLSGTPKQVSALIPSAENGLFSRFIFYYMNVQPMWKDVFLFSGDESLDAYFNSLGYEFFELYKNLKEQGAIEFRLTPEQQAQFNQFFGQVQGAYVSLKGLDYLATVRRLGLIAFRISMILSALRIMEHGTIPQQVVCEEQDFQTTLKMIKTLVKHAAKVFSELPEEEQLPKRKNKRERFYKALPKEFTRQNYADIAVRQGIPDKTAQYYIAEFCKSGLVLHDGRDKYVNLGFQDYQDCQFVDL